MRRRCWECILCGMRSTLCNRRGERLDHAFLDGRAGDARVVLIAHGLTSHKDRPWLIALSEALAEQGIASLRFSFSGNGASQGRFEESTITKEVQDLGCVLDALEGRTAIYAGHSMGAAVGVLRARADERIRALVSLAGMVHVQRFMERCFGHLRPGADVMLGKAQCPLTEGFLADAAAIGDVLGAAARIDVPWLVAHGSADELVPFQDALDACATNPRRAELLEIPGADHRFSGRERELARAVASWCAALSLAERRLGRA